MKRFLLLCFVCLTISAEVDAQSSSVTLQVTDAGGQTWNNGTWSVLLVSQLGATTFGPPFNLTTGGSVPNQSQSGALNATGGATMTLSQTSFITPTKSQWQFNVCPAQGIPFQCFVQSVTIVGASPTVTITPPAIAVSCGLGAGAYVDAEVSCGVGGQYYNVVSAANRQCTVVTGNACTTWTGAGGVSANSPLPLATSGPGPVFNVANYAGAFHDTRSNSTCDSSISATQVTCSAVAGVTPFTSADVGKRINCSDGANGLAYPTGTTITSIVSGTVAQLSGTRTFSGPGQKCTYGHPDDAALVSVFAAAFAQTTSVSGQARGNAGVPTAAPTIYFPAGGWMACNPNAGLPVFYFGTNRKGFTIAGDGYDVTFLYNCDNAPAMTASGFWISNQNMTNLLIRDFTIDGGFLPVNAGGFGYAIYSAPQIFIRNVHMQALRFTGGAQFQGAVYATNFTLDTSDAVALSCNGCGGEFREWSASNSTHNLQIVNVVGLNTGQGLKFFGGLVDEGGSTAVTQIVNSQDVWFIGTAGFGTGNNAALSVDGKSFVHLIDNIWGSFGNDGNSGGITIAAGGVVQASDTRFVGTGTANCINNSGTFNDNGGNSCESMFAISSGTSTGTTAVLTLANMGAAINTNCSVGDALIVEGAALLGYNGYYPAGATSGITATSATTVTYTTAGSNLGALSAGGVAFCRNLQTYSGTLPKALLNNPIPNTCYLTITPIVNATTYQLCNFGAGSATNITRITASSQNVTTCATAPIITISNGTVSQTLTLTSGKQFWDSFNAQDASTGVGTTIFKPSISATGTDRITVKYDAGALSACATPPTQLAISYNISPILSN